MTKKEMKELDKLRFEKNFLKKVIFRLDYSGFESISEKDAQAFYNEIKDDYPIFEKRQLVEFYTTIKTGQRIDEQKRKDIYDIFDADKAIKCTLANDHLLLEINTYLDFSWFKKIVETFYNCLSNRFGVLNTQRIGLRYINQIEIKNGDPLSWRGYINNSLLSVIDSFFKSMKEDVARSMGQTTLNRDDYILIFHYGVNNSEYPSRVVRKEFILDYDCYTRDVQGSDIINDYLVPFHYEILRLFKMSIGSKLVGEMSEE
jgi:uncharacterized protein (TIGR04255 family)